MNLTDDEIVTLGNFCEAVLSQPAFTAVTDLHERMIFTDFMSTEPKNTKEREHIYATLAGGKALLDTMKMLVARKTEICKEQAAPSSDEDDALI